MPLYLIERRIGDMTEDEMAAGGLRALAAQEKLTSDKVRWIRSYFDPEGRQMRCIYEAESADLVRQHAEMARIPCDSITEVIEHVPDTYR